MVDPEVAWAWRRIVATRGQIRVGDLAARTGWSRQRLWSRFGAQVGLTPKGAAMLVRFDHRDVRAFTAATPRAAVGEPWLAVDDTAWPAHSCAA